MKKILFIDRDGTLIKEAPPTYQIDHISKLAFYPGAIQYMSRIAKEFDFELTMVSNQDGLGTASFPNEDFEPIHQLIIQTFEGEGVVFDQQFIDPSLPEEQSPNRKPGIGMLTKYIANDQYDLVGSYVIGDRLTDVQLAKNLGSKCILINNPDGVGFIDQIARHGKMDLKISVKGDLHIDEHHTIEDTGIALGEAIYLALSDKRGMERYGFALPMDDAEAKVLIDFGGRNWIVWDAEFNREKVGDMPTEMFFHFFKSFSDACKCNLNISCKGENEHHKIEAIFKAFAKAIRMAVKKDPMHNALPSTKGVL